jgi:hypothetical protein
MIKIEFIEEQIKELHFERFNHPHPRVQLKMEVLSDVSLKTKVDNKI